jgi:hypothetical protein
MIKSALKGIWWEYLGLATVLSVVCGYVLWKLHLPMPYMLIPFVLVLYIANERHSALYKSLRNDTCRPLSQQVSLRQMGVAMLSALQQLKLINRNVTRQSVKSTLREDGSVRVFLDGVEPSEAQCFADSFKELLSDLKDQSHYISKYEFVFPVQNPSPKAEERFFSRYLAGMAELEIASVHPIPKLIARSEKTRQHFASVWNKYVGPGSVEDVSITPIRLMMGNCERPILSTRLLWE